MYAAVIEFDTLADPVGASAEDHDLRTVGGYRIIVRRIVSRVVISAVLGAAYMNGIPSLDNAELFSLCADLIFGNSKDLAEILVRETVLLGLDEGFCSERGVKQGFLFLHEFFHLVDEVMLNTCKSEDLIGSGALAQRLIHDKIALAVRDNEEL